NLIRCLSKIDNRKFKLANPNQDYNATDVTYKKLPNKRLVYWARSNEYLIITYEQGGFGSSIKTRVIEYKDKSLGRVFTYT
ncbi:hypothetical protein, partial [Rhizobium leguminosarum]|uniref:hypothetical protein n=1 Tax=Rhizobium leguminosarum TaxID=384 RepID=UPI003F9DA62C